MNSETKNCQNCKEDFIIEQDDFSFYEKMKVPPPTFCPECRLIRRMATFNVRNIYNRKCDNCGENTVSIFNPKAPYKNWCFKCYFSDKFDPSLYGIDYDFSTNFFTQYEKLRRNVPLLCLEQSGNNSGGCEYANYTYSSKNIYLSHNVASSEDVYYSVFVNKKNRMCFDSLSFKEDELCYEVVDSNHSYDCSYLTRSDSCISSSFLFNCSNCQNCFMSSNQQKQNYIFRNKKLSKSEYEEAITKENLHSYDLWKKLVEEYGKLMKDSIVCFSKQINAIDCTGDIIENSKNCWSSFYIWKSENIKYVTYSVNSVTDSYDILDSGRGERMYESICSGRGNYEITFSSRVFGSTYSYYSEGCIDCKNIFGCVGLKKKQYCILNKQYTKEEYEEILPKIIKHMEEMPYVDKNNCKYVFGEFFPIEISPFAYNETMAYEQFPLSKEKALAKNYKWFDDLDRDHKSTLEYTNIPDDISDVADSILKETISCEHGGSCNHQCTKAFRIAPEELQFYKRMNLSLPRICPNCRYFIRLKRALPWKLWSRVCMCSKDSHDHTGKCDVQFKTPYSPDRPETIYCKKCFQKEVY
ncbi:MAG: hypothetical protein UR85_C0002G0027 [Candidatus Nomurabacteria bacterium GW2011_GWF2_35_66]|uniref:Zinc-binding domain-containing protein n=1 Tax=Candidatus Nomurabacteria bacterium GW2011_GWE1_35_16 TaxID=1618761 RepID=A0A0G0BAM6_9BACT|nr:MAG: hypothetical protein UR55_C0007G0015 [Candidatus Nomurabacteria bacterium GW2011_GWF1_34_20]KKP63290.1 MAG: hypothetical protein UR57_C0006G0015 [Candidatus Nomurabacteria bacterium GW2011_GWE2_34_25]KKP66488.1 MAG: hypothetical protein UR64_C0006G0015 [Candidatus Nomurabacteria bacterium GW2011_GWE1_35_16]KKP83714.1 MAG: hypothetical protein UR85_C0002G0027 [Candidatus Nomurabacteria bacterium GW2011_GWF2_35_66]HAE36924.1 hypothetical protein [Candidatus Nomurabacteria bacterium]